MDKHNRTGMVLWALALLFFAHFSLFLFSGCEKARYADEHDVKLTFSADTVSFDTLFTTQSSATRQVKVYNRTGHDVVISTITLAGGSQSPFRLNVDGDTSLVARNVEILAGDSIFIFIQANLRYDNFRTLPFIVEDAILFGNGQRLPVSAYGRNAVFHTPTDIYYFPDGTYMHCSILDCANWDHTRPHVFIDTVVVLNGSTLNLQAGEEIYFYNNAILLFDTNARIVATGTPAQPVRFSSLRHDGWYSFLPGQWQCMLFTGGSTGNVIDYAIIENGTGGLRVFPQAELTVKNTVIRNMSDCALIGQGGTMTGHNLLVYDCLGSLTVLRGGRYSFTSCTFADFWSYSSRQQESVILSNYLIYSDGTQVGDTLDITFSKCIIWGNRENEVIIAGLEDYPLSYSFDTCWVKGTEGVSDPLFVDTKDDNYRLQDNSPASGLGYQFDN